MVTQLVFVVFAVGATLFKRSLRLRRLKSDWDEIWYDSSSNKCASIDRVGFLITSYFQDGGYKVISRRKSCYLHAAYHDAA